MAKKKKEQSLNKNKNNSSKHEKQEVAAEPSMTDFVSALVAQTTSSHTAHTSSSVVIPSKAERIAKRQAKRQRKEQQQLRLGSISKKQKQQQQQRDLENNNTNYTATQRKSQARHVRQALLEQWSNDLADAIKALPSVENRYMLKIVATSDKKPRNFPHMVHHKKLHTSSQMEPRKCDYGGLGLARPTLYLSFADPAFIPRLQEEFAEHVPGWSGKAPMQAAMKKQRDSNLLWRRLQREKVAAAAAAANGKGRRAGSKMTVDERVEAMLKNDDNLI